METSAESKEEQKIQEAQDVKEGSEKLDAEINEETALIRPATLDLRSVHPTSFPTELLSSLSPVGKQVREKNGMYGLRKSRVELTGANISDLCFADSAIEFLERRGGGERNFVPLGSTDERGTTEGEAPATAGGAERRGKSADRTFEEAQLYATYKEGTANSSFGLPGHRRCKFTENIASQNKANFSFLLSYNGD